MSNKSLQKLSSRFLKSKTTSTQKLQKLQKESSYKQIPNLRVSRKRDAWSHAQKNILKIAQSSQSKLVKSVKLEPIGPRPSFKILQPIDKIDKNGLLSTKRYQESSQMAQIQNEIISKKIRFITAFERHESQQQKKIRKYFTGFLPKNNEKDLIILQQVNSTLNRINYFWWNLLATLFQNLKFTISNNNVPLAKSLALTYFLMQEEKSKSQSELLAQFEDSNHIFIICQTLYFQRLVCFYILDPQQSPFSEKYEASWILEALNKIATIRSLILQILNETEESFLKSNKLKKPSYLIREKKLIQINKVVNLLKQNTNKTLKGSMLTKCFIFDQKSMRIYDDLTQKTAELKQKFLSIPRSPFLKLINDRYCLVCDPEGIFYTEDKKNTCLVFKSYTEFVLKQLSKLVEIVIFSKKKIKSVEPFLLQSNYITFAGVIDKQYETFCEGKKVKDLSKTGLNPQKTLVLDLKYQKYYHFHLNNCIPVPKQPHEAYFKFLVEKIKKFINQQQLIVQRDVALRFFKYNDFSGEEPFKK